jgi:hypothetical protein
VFRLLKSLLLSLSFGFVSPVILFGLILFSLSALSHIPSLYSAATGTYTKIEGFLNVFGNGNWLIGLLVIGLTCSLVAGLLELFNIFQQSTKLDKKSK